MHKAPQARHSLAPSVAEVRGFRRKPALRHKGGVSRTKRSYLAAAGRSAALAKRHKEMYSLAAKIHTNNHGSNSRFTSPGSFDLVVSTSPIPSTAGRQALGCRFRLISTYILGSLFQPPTDVIGSISAQQQALSRKSIWKSIFAHAGF
jgi:hypothetical protein